MGIICLLTSYVVRKKLYNRIKITYKFIFNEITHLNIFQNLIFYFYIHLLTLQDLYKILLTYYFSFHYFDKLREL